MMDQWDEDIELEYRQFVQEEKLSDLQQSVQLETPEKPSRFLRNTLLFLGAELTIFALLYLMPKLPY